MECNGQNRARHPCCQVLSLLQGTLGVDPTCLEFFFNVYNEQRCEFLSLYDAHSNFIVVC